MDGLLLVRPPGSAADQAEPSEPSAPRTGPPLRGCGDGWLARPRGRGEESAPPPPVRTTEARSGGVEVRARSARKPGSRRGRMPAQGQRGGDGLDGDRVLVGEIGDRPRYVEDLAAPAGGQRAAVVRAVKRCLGCGGEKRCSAARGDRRCRQGVVRRVSALEGAALARGEDARAELGRRGGRRGTLGVDGRRKVDDDRKTIKQRAPTAAAGIGRACRRHRRTPRCGRGRTGTVALRRRAESSPGRCRRGFLGPRRRSGPRAGRAARRAWSVETRARSRRKRTPRCASVTSPGRSGEPPPTSPAALIV